MVLYIGITNGLQRRISQHVSSNRSHFACRYNTDKLIYYEVFSHAGTAIAREKQLKGWRRSKKEASIARSNPTWRDLLSDVVSVE